MELDIDTPETVHRTTDVQFSMRAMLIVTGAVAVVATALGSAALQTSTGV